MLIPTDPEQIKEEEKKLHEKIVKLNDFLKKNRLNIQGGNGGHYGIEVEDEETGRSTEQSYLG